MNPKAKPIKPPKTAKRIFKTKGQCVIKTGTLAYGQVDGTLKASEVWLQGLDGIVGTLASLHPGGAAAYASLKLANSLAQGKPASSTLQAATGFGDKILDKNITGSAEYQGGTTSIKLIASLLAMQKELSTLKKEEQVVATRELNRWLGCGGGAIIDGDINKVVPVFSTPGNVECLMSFITWSRSPNGVKSLFEGEQLQAGKEAEIDAYVSKLKWDMDNLTPTQTFFLYGSTTGVEMTEIVWTDLSGYATGCQGEEIPINIYEETRGLVRSNEIK